MSANADLDFELPNVGPGPDPLTLGSLADVNEAVVILFQRDFYCGNCRRQVTAVSERYAEFRERGAEVVSVLPESPGRARDWLRDGASFPLVADEESRLGDRYGQRVRFGAVGRLHDFVGRMPTTVIVDLRERDPPRRAYVHRGATPWDRPTIDELLAELNRL
ncbi:peroxiredoxin family protein [Haloprofundus salinisoli]|uniref:peroxiredoxin family protein n=1 Tax=Haloprofundus salinisoli TaxID=2876193 RepID=UPI001CCE4A9B|nr:redoxin domain-containing protein [Haloprofundus salinisoli]